MIRFGSSYHRNNLSGLGADDAALPLADQALLALVSSAPSLVYTEWATQTGDAAWSEATPAQDYQAFVVSDAQLASVASTASSEVQSLAVVSPVLTQMTAVKTVFEGTPFAYDHTEAVYAQADTKSPPKIYFLYWLKLRDQTDPKSGTASLNSAATQVGGALVYILEVAPAANGRPHPASGSFPSAFSAQMQPVALSIPATPAVQATTVPGAQAALLAPSAAALPGWQRMAGGRSDVRSPTRTEVRSPTRTSTEVRSPTRTATEVRSPTSTSTDAYTQGNFTATVTGGAGSGATTVNIFPTPLPYTRDSRGRKQLAKTAMDVDTSGPTSDLVPRVDAINGGKALLLVALGAVVAVGAYKLIQGRRDA